MGSGGGFLWRKSGGNVEEEWRKSGESVEDIWISTESELDLS